MRLANGEYTIEWDADVLPVTATVFLRHKRMGIGWAELAGLVEEGRGLVWNRQGIRYYLRPEILASALQRWTSLLEIHSLRETVLTQFRLSEAERLD